MELGGRSDGARTKTGFDIRADSGGGSEPSLSERLTIGPKLEPDGCGVKDERNRKEGPLDCSRDEKLGASSSDAIDFMETSLAIPLLRLKEGGSRDIVLELPIAVSLREGESVCRALFG